MTAAKAVVAGSLSLLLVSGAVGGVFVGTAGADSAPLDPASPATPVTVTADALPTVQINGVVWSQVVIGNTVYVGGEFTRARPAGAPVGTSETTRNNLLAYDIRTGQLITGFAPDLNGQVKVVAASPDGSRLYVGGSFTKANGETRYRIAAYDTATGALDPAFKPAFDSQVKAIAVSGTTVYAGGIFKAVGGQARTRLAAVSRTTGALLPWAPAADSSVAALVMSPNGSKVVVGGSFITLGGTVAAGGQVARGIGAIDAATGKAVPFAAGKVVNNTGSGAAVLSLSVDADTVYGSGYTYDANSNLEGVVAADPETGAVRWINDCHGDSYSVWASGTSAYVAGHPHVCSNIGGFPETQPWSFYRGIAFSKAATGKVGTETGNFTGQPAPSLLNWFPTIDSGTYTGQSQGPWSVAGNSQYVVYGGEFPTVNGKAQQGLVRFAVRALAPNAIGPNGNSALVPTATSLSPGTARVAWTATSDRDSENLTYRVYRDGNMTTPVYETTRDNRFWNRPTMAYTDTAVGAGSHRYRLTVSDPTGNTVTTDWVSVQVAAGTTAARPYADAVRTDGAQYHWPLGETSGTTAHDLTGANDARVGTGVGLNQAGAISGDRNTSARFDGTSAGLVAMQKPVYGPQTFTIEAWFSATTWNGGKIVGFGNRTSGSSPNYDRHVYLDRSGRLVFGVFPGAERTVTSPNRYNDGAWHHVVAAIGPAGMTLYVDGKPVASRSDTTSAQNYSGYWRIGGDSSWGGTAQYLNGRIDEVAIYPRALSADRVLSHYTLGSTGKRTNVAPTAAFTSSTAGLTASFDGSGSRDSDGTIATTAWDFGDGTTGTGTTASHAYAKAGTYTVTLTVTDDGGATAKRVGTVTVTAPPANVAPTASFTAAGSGLGVTVDGSGSRDPDGQVASYAWQFGDGASGTGATASHTYAAAGAYTVTLTVTDDDGAAGTMTRSVTATAPQPGAEPVPALAADAFERTVASGFGRADSGGAWSASGGARSVSDGAGHLTVTAAGGSSAVWLSTVSVSDVAVQTGISLDAAPTGAGTYVYLVGRRTASGHYRAVARFLADGTVRLGLSRVEANKETTLTSVVLPGTYAVGSTLQVRLDLAGTGTTTLNAKAWVAGTAEPSAWQVSATDTTAVLQSPGAVGVTAYLSGSATAVPVTVDVDDLWVGPAGSAPAAG